MAFFGNSEDAAKLAALGKSLATIEFKLDGTIITANQNFLSVLGYELAEIKGKHHSMFVKDGEAETDSYKDFWKKLNAGNFQAAEYERVGKGGKEVWIQASYNPILNRAGKPFKVMKVATDITAEKLRNANFEGQMAAIDKSQATIEFELDGTIITANQNFLSVLGYRLDEIKGKHHRMFVPSDVKNSAGYKAFWDKLNAGEYQAAEYERLGKNDKEIWIQASYNPILDYSGKPFKVVKYATDITEQVISNRNRHDAQQVIDGDLSKISEAMDNTSRQSTTAAQASESVSATVQVVASGVEELASSVSEISSQVTTASQISGEAVEQAKQSNQIVQDLAASAAQIGEVVNLISDIAEQTNLLALNATIEAARAGESGKGFAVVASEVKSLAAQTAKATEQIRENIGDIQGSSSSAVDALKIITETIGRINDISMSISGAVEEQSTVTSEIANNMQEASVGVGNISENVKQIAEDTQFVNDATQKVKAASAALS